MKVTESQEDNNIHTCIHDVSCRDSISTAAMVCRDLASYIVPWTAVPGWRTGVVYVCAGSTWPVTNISWGRRGRRGLSGRRGRRGLSGWQRSWSFCWNCKYIENQLVSAATSRRGRPGGGGGGGY